MGGNVSVGIACPRKVSGIIRYLYLSVACVDIIVFLIIRVSFVVLIFVITVSVRSGVKNNCLKQKNRPQLVDSV